MMSRQRTVVGVAAILLGAVFWGGWLVSAAEFHVSPQGRDIHPGTRRQPFATLTRARDEVRRLRQQRPAEPVTVHVGGGVYRVTAPLTLTGDDSGTAAAPVSYVAAPGERPVISGGRPITGWRATADGLWEAELPADVVGGWRFRELFVNGRRALRARHPNSGYLRVDDVAPDQRSWFTYREGDVPACDDADRIELVMLHDWAVSRAPVAAVDRSSRRVTLRFPLGRGSWLHKMRHWEKHPRYCLENSVAFLDSPGEWHLDAEHGIVRYRPRPGERLDDVEVVAPVAEALLVMRGEPGPPPRFVEHIRFAGLTFEHCAFVIPEDGFYCGVQATFHFPDPDPGPRLPVPAAVSAERTASCVFSECVFRHVGGGGVWLGRECTGNRMEACIVSDVSGNGIMIGEPRERQVGEESWLKAAPEQVASDNQIHNSLVETCGRQFHGAVGIWSGIAAGTTVTRCDVRHVPYTGISAGWQWDPTPTPCRTTTIADNHIHDVMQILSDGGGIYTLGLQPGSLIRGNLIHGVPANAGRAESNGMFLDQGTTDFTIEGNVIYDVSRSPLRFHQATRNLVRGNVLVCGAGVPPIRYNATDADVILKEDNEVVHQTRPLPADGVRGGAVEFTGSQVVEIPHDASFDTPVFTLSAWVRMERYPGARPSAGGRDVRTWIVGKNTNEWQDGHYGLVVRGEGAVGGYLNIGGGPDQAISAFSADGVLPLAGWTQVAIQFDGATLAVIVGGDKVAEAEAGRERHPGRGVLTIGARPDGYTHIDGFIDEVVYYDRTLSVPELAVLARPGAEPPASGRAAYWPLDDVPGAGDEGVFEEARERLRRTAGIEPSAWARMAARQSQHTE